MWRVTRKQIMNQKVDHVSSRQPPYTTKTGVKIGLAYQPRPQELTPDGEFIQSILLGQKTPVLQRGGMMLYAVLVAAVFVTLAVVVGK